jgi:hypothetical protein
MNIDQPEMDPIEAFLGQGAGEKTNEKLRQVIQQQTLGVLRRRRWLRRGGWLAGLAACYAAGILTMRLWPRPEVGNQVAIAPQENAVGQSSMAPPASEPRNPTMAQPPETALALEWKALDSIEKRPDLFRLAGDKYLEDNNIESATRCYRGALDNASDQDLKISVNDNWLLMSLKQAKQEEKRYAKLIRP